MVRPHLPPITQRAREGVLSGAGGITVERAAGARVIRAAAAGSHSTAGCTAR
jgi:hypothetical protein